MSWIKTISIPAVMGTFLVATTLQAGGTHSHSHDDQVAPVKSSQGKSESHDMPGHNDPGGHQHDSWQPPPADYAAIRYDGWGDDAIAKRGEQVYQAQCVACHGSSGKGDGLAAKGLEHPPADLTNHFHTAPGQGDGYLYWRVSEGGTAEPFRSMKSAMPSFKTVLSEEQRWEVLTYIHQKYHGGFLKSMPHDGMQSNEGDRRHDPDHQH